MSKMTENQTDKQIDTQLVDGSLDVPAQQNALNFLEQASFAKVITYNKVRDAANRTTANEVVLQNVPIGEQPGPLILKSVSTEGESRAVVEDQIALGHTVVFHEKAYVLSKEQIMFGFRVPAI